MENDLEAMQNYLRTEILDKNYSGEEFFNFLIQKKGDEGGDLSNWLMFDLKLAVKEFQMSRPNQHMGTSIPPNPNQQTGITNENHEFGFEPVPLNSPDKSNFKTKTVLQSQLIESQIEVPEIKSPGSNKTNYDQSNPNNMIEIECLLPEKTPLSNHENIKVVLSFPEKKAESSGLMGLFSKKHFISFMITTLPVNFKVRRRYTDFEWLRNTFTSQYPGIFIPPMPLKTLHESALDQKIEKRMRFLEKFINSIIKDPILRNSNLLFDFLSTEKDSDYEKKKTLYSKLQSPIQLSKMHSRSGKIIIDKSIFQETKLFTEIKDNLAQNTTELTRLVAAYKNLFTEMKQVSNRMIEISEIYKTLYTMSMKNSENENLIKSYNSMKKLMEDIGYTERQQAMNIEHEVREYFKFVKNEYMSIKELYDKYDYSKNLYSNTKDKLLKRKEDLFRKGDISKWELKSGDKVDLSNKEAAFAKILPQDTLFVENLKMFTCYNANYCKNEFNRMREVIGFQNKEAFKLFYQKNSTVLNELNNSWNIFRNC